MCRLARMSENVALAAAGLSRVFARPPFGRCVPALDGFSVEVRPGEILGLAGPNGAGKTTALRCCLGLLAPTQGRVLLFGALAGTRAARGLAGFSPERFDLSGGRSGRETLELLGALSGLRGRDLEARAGDLLARFDLLAAAERPLCSYSKGMVRRLSIAAALLSDPPLLVLDEPFDGLDPLGAQAVREEIQRRARAGAAVVLSSHALAEVEAVATHLLLLGAGRTLVAGPADAVLAQDGRCELQLDGLDAAGLEALRRLVEERGARLERVRPGRGTLEELFRRSLGRER